MDYALLLKQLNAVYTQRLLEAQQQGRTLRKVWLVGNIYTSFFLKHLKARLEKYGFAVESTGVEQFRGISLQTGTPVIFDTDDDSGVTQLPRMNMRDVDHQFSNGISSCAQAINDFLCQCNMVDGLNITIIGRGHAVQGLPDLLLNNNGTVTVCHSKSPNITQSCSTADVVVCATPVLDCPIDAHNLVLDISGAAKDQKLSCDYFDRIGSLTQNILCYNCL